ncbi:MAG: bifunctional phosphoribosylaminoimidazolecarboxamide formyltransferase/IMP cyclohydrolase [Anaerolineae bacterium]|nr:bifunctional phosphoribosylaminoimidazolecarboxamide formyltransferase/IMP cyclohydrolase [Anaerolineae bacterium]
MKALLSVSDKTHLVEFAQGLRRFGVELIASGGTARALQAAGVPVITVEEYTTSPEILDGRVKTLHPRIHAGILARNTEQDRADLERIGASPIDLVVVNLYPFRKTVAQPYVTLRDAIEHIDIGGVALLRAAAKNFERVAVVCDPCDYGLVLNDLEKYGEITLETREVFALKAFAHTAEYDASIRDYLMGLKHSEAHPSVITLTLQKVQDLRYGENPHQQATFFSLNGACTKPLGARLLQGKELSYNNLLDLDAAWRAVLSFDQPAAVIVKHTSPCGAAVAPTLSVAYQAAYQSDPVSAFGGVIAFNQTVDEDTVAAIGDLFIECVIAPEFTEAAQQRLSSRKSCRVLVAEDIAVAKSMAWEYRSIAGGILRQSVDHGDPEPAQWRVVTRQQPTEWQLRALRFAWQVCQHVKSNAIVLARAEGDLLATVGIGAGQPNRVDSVRIACERAGARAKGAVLASDAFFPFADGVQVAARAGVSAIVQPGGSVRDEDTIAAADEAGIAMVFTGVRHFKH